MSVMYSVVFEEHALNSIKKYIQNYKTYFVKLYEDSGLWNEDIIIESYIKNGDSIVSEIMEVLTNTFSSETILGRISDTKHILLFHNKVLIITYREDINKKTRYIDELIIAERK